jgi:hypothetical protein
VCKVSAKVIATSTAGLFVAAAKSTPHPAPQLAKPAR